MSAHYNHQYAAHYAYDPNSAAIASSAYPVSYPAGYSDPSGATVSSANPVYYGSSDAAASSAVASSAAAASYYTYGVSADPSLVAANASAYHAYAHAHAYGTTYDSSSTTDSQGYTVESETGAVPYPAGYVPTSASVSVVKAAPQQAVAGGVDDRKGKGVAPVVGLGYSSTAVASGTGSATGTEKEKKGKKKTVFRAAGGEVWEDPTLQEWDNNDFRLFCGDLGNEVTDELLAKAFAKYTSFQKARVVRDKRSNKTKGYGFVSFKDPNDFVKAMKEMQGKYVGNRPIKLRKSTWDERNADPRSLRKTQGGGITKR
ncbi:RNA-binding protein 42 [Quaeritorhiza haematococci]|nr:RNA-binding protein 42 [Quaeritorhiza haematococci]